MNGKEFTKVLNNEGLVYNKIVKNEFIAVENISDEGKKIVFYVC